MSVYRILRSGNQWPVYLVFTTCIDFVCNGMLLVLGYITTENKKVTSQQKTKSSQIWTTGYFQFMKKAIWKSHATTPLRKHNSTKDLICTTTYFYDFIWRFTAKL